MAALQNLIPDPSTRDLWQCRPAGILLASVGGGSAFSSGFSSGFGSGLFPGATFIPCYIVVGTRVYGMVSDTRNPGKDEPFAYDIPSATFITISGVTAANSPTSPAQTGAWTPPTMALIGANIIVTHPGFTGVGGAFFGVLNILNPAAPTWTAQNTTINALVFPPTWVVNFNQRAFFGVNPPGQQPGVYMSDVLIPTQITNGNQILTFGDNTPLTCAAGLGLSNQLGGIVQALMVFKGVSNIFQVTGDYALGTLAINALNIATGTLAPNTLVSTSQGLVFIAPDGLRLIDFNAAVHDPIGISGDGITVPFYNSVVPSRMCAAYNTGIYRVQVQNGNAPGSPQQQWWFDFARQIWSGPHTQAAALMAPYSNTFVVTLQGAGAQLFTSDVFQTSISTFTENGVPLAFTYQTSMMPDVDAMAEIAMVETTLMASLAANSPITVSAIDQDGNVFDAVTLLTVASSTIWGAFQWGAALWQGARKGLFPQRLAWHFPIVFRRLALTATGICASGVKLGRLHLRYQILRYMQQGQSTGD